MKQTVYFSRTLFEYPGFFSNGYMVIDIAETEVPKTMKQAQKLVDKYLGADFVLSDDWNRCHTYRNDAGVSSE